MPSGTREIDFSEEKPEQTIMICGKIYPVSRYPVLVGSLVNGKTETVHWSNGETTEELRGCYFESIFRLPFPLTTV